jgi:hypothetical protein
LWSVVVKIATGRAGAYLTFGIKARNGVEWRTDDQHWEKGTAVCPFSGAAAKTVELTYAPK